MNAVPVADDGGERSTRGRPGMNSTGASTTSVSSQWDSPSGPVYRRRYRISRSFHTGDSDRIRVHVSSGAPLRQFTWRSRLSQYGARKTRLRILPEGLRGRASTKSTDFGAL